jgi:hypothetical protein
MHPGGDPMSQGISSHDSRPLRLEDVKSVFETGRARLTRCNNSCAFACSDTFFEIYSSALPTTRITLEARVESTTTNPFRCRCPATGVPPPVATG